MFLFYFYKGVISISSKPDETGFDVLFKSWTNSPISNFTSSPILILSSSSSSSSAAARILAPSIAFASNVASSLGAVMIISFPSGEIALSVAVNDTLLFLLTVVSMIVPVLVPVLDDVFTLMFSVFNLNGGKSSTLSSNGFKLVVFD